jgi:hypothetical protein
MDETRVNDIFIFPNDSNCYKINRDGTFTNLTLSDQPQPGAVGYNISRFMRHFENYLTINSSKNDNEWQNAAVLVWRENINKFIDNIHLTFPVGGEYCFFEFLQFCDYVKAYLNCQAIFAQKYNEFKSKDLFKLLPSLSLSFKPKSLKKSLKTSRKKAPKKAAR